MSNNRIKSCECFRFPSGTAMCASERIRQKANIQIYKNNVLLNCKDQNSRVYSGTHNRLRSINGFKLHEESKANSDCGGNPDCIFSDKKAADYWIVRKPSAAALCPNRETITLEQALAQGGVLDCQDLVLRKADYETINDGDIVHREGLFIRSGESFTVAAGGTITFVDPIAFDGAQESVGIKVEGTFETSGIIRFQALIEGVNAFGIQVADSGEFTHSGGEITFEGEISTAGAIDPNSIANGIKNNGTFTQSNGTILFKGSIGNNSIVQIAAGIYNGGTFTQENGNITFRGAIEAITVAEGIRNINSFNQNADGIITFQDNLIVLTDYVRGIFNANRDGNTANFQQSGTIQFLGTMERLPGANPSRQIYLIEAQNDTKNSFIVNGNISFPGTFTAANFSPSSSNNDRFGGNGNGSITYNNGNDRYYPDTS